MSIKKEDQPALLLIDMQKGFNDIKYWGGKRNNLGAERNVKKLLSLWRANNLPIFHIQHCSSNPNSPLREMQKGNEFLDTARPLITEIVIKKRVNSAFIGTNLKQTLDDLNIKKLVIVGLTTDHCISTSARMAGNFGFETYVVSDATATFDKVGLRGKHYSANLIHDVALASLKDEFATIVTTSFLKQQL